MQEGGATELRIGVLANNGVARRLYLDVRFSRTDLPQAVVKASAGSPRVRAIKEAPCPVS